MNQLYFCLIPFPDFVILIAIDLPLFVFRLLLPMFRQLPRSKLDNHLHRGF